MMSNLKSDKKLVQAMYLQLACEDCYHMKVIESDDKNLISKTIIPQSDSYNVEDLISAALIDKKNLCLEGYTYKFNFSNLMRIDPPGIKFNIEKSLPIDDCSGLASIGSI